MKTITIEKNVYEYSELSEQAKEEAKNSCWKDVSRIYSRLA